MQPETAGPSPLTVLRGHRREAIPIVLAAAAGWTFLVWGALDMQSPLARLMMPMSADWSAVNFAAVFVMWAVMMAAMMLPSALPMLLTFAHLNRRAGTPGRTRSFAAAYVAIWSAFSVLATALQWVLQAAELSNPMIVVTSPWLGAALLAIAGIFQFTPLKRACLHHCRTPMGFLLTDWRGGTGGAWTMGLRHGAYCLGCCWALMALLFVGGVMNILWIAALAALVAAEKLMPRGERIAPALGVILIGAGAVHLAWLLG
ncbi:DUF2182 domain-containing protein [Minwuia thermotolerans]|uniref:Metal-binding protein n=1 Tax=Minwuia thermotolerans TaxID=2056226 RepID=A0A2M9FX27_9PROT|nr:DUF2182 domain-containing protein [Minwuia thermotolerans]PJK28003.1 hypothetical protein CVT23_19270 [Minwuia thermotolerans]